jgi:6-phosphogluconolactonase
VATKFECDGHDDLSKRGTVREMGAASRTPIGHFPTEKTPRGFAIDLRSRFLLSVGLDSNALTVYRIDSQSGALTSVKQYAMGQPPNWIEIVDLR